LLSANGKLAYPAGTAAAVSLYSGSDTDTGIYSPGSNQFGIATAGTSRIVVDSSGQTDFSGNVKIGTNASRHSELTPASANLQIDGGIIFEPGSGNNVEIFNYRTTALTFGNGATEQMRIDSSGRLLINRTNSTGSHNLEVFGGTDNEPIKVSSSDAGAYILFADNDTTGSTRLGAIDNDLKFDVNSNERMRIDSSGRLLVGTFSNTAPGGFNAKLQIADTSFTGSISMRRDSNNNSSQSLVFGKSRGSLNGNTIVQNGDQLGAIAFYGADGTDLNSQAASINAAVDGTPGSNDMPGRLVFSTTADGASSPTERLRIDSSGNVGIGDSAPNGNYGTNLSVHSTATNGARVKISDGTTGKGNTDGLDIISTGGAAYFINRENSFMSFTTNSIEGLRIDSSGDVFVGRTSDSTSAAGISLLSSGKGVFNRDGNNALSVNRGSSDGALVEFKRAGTTKGSISISGSTTSYNTSSDYRLKENVVDIADGITRVKRLQPRKFNFIKNPDATVDGFIAHEAQTVVPEAVTGEKDGEEMQGLDLSKLVPLLTAALQESILEIEKLKKRVEDLEG